jgi:hypothetical protein
MIQVVTWMNWLAGVAESQSLNSITVMGSPLIVSPDYRQRAF